MRPPWRRNSKQRGERRRQTAEELKSALGEGARESRGRLSGTPAKAGAGARRAFGSLLDLLLRILRRLGAAGRGFAAGVLVPLAGLGRAAGRQLERAAEALTPRRALLTAAAGCCLVLIVSQFADYRGVSVGDPAAFGEIETVAPAPLVESDPTGSAHAYVFVPLGLLALVALGLAQRSGRWQLTRIATLTGATAIAIALIVDRPAGLDEGTIGRDFAGAQASLLGGFWAELFAGVGLVATSVLLAAELRHRSGASQSRRTRRRSERRPSAGTAEPARTSEAGR